MGELRESRAFGKFNHLQGGGLPRLCFPLASRLVLTPQLTALRALPYARVHPLAKMDFSARGFGKIARLITVWRPLPL